MVDSGAVIGKETPLDDDLHPCRKCATLNPSANVYCRKCGAVLEIETSVVKAQPRPIMPAAVGMRWRWVGLQTMVTLGLISVLLAGSLAIGTIGFEMVLETNADDQSIFKSNLAGILILIGALFIVAFGFAGFVVAWLARRRNMVEAAVSTVLVIALLGVVGSALTGDSLTVAALMLLPSMAAAWLGGRIGESFSSGEKKR